MTQWMKNVSAVLVANLLTVMLMVIFMWIERWAMGQ